MRGVPPEPVSHLGELPHLWQKPAFDQLFACLQALRLEPPIWNLKTSRAKILEAQKQQPQRDDSERSVTPREIVSFLSGIIKNSLAWIQDDDQREQIWEEASKRLSERCGRTGNVPSPPSPSQ